MKTKSEKLANLLKWLQRIDIYWLVIIPLVLAIILLFGLFYVGEKLYKGEIPESYYGFSWIIFLIVASLSGFAQVIRKEGPGPFGDISYGAWPVISGYIIIGVTWAAAIYLLIISI